jgi:hypothetical protein
MIATTTIGSIYSVISHGDAIGVGGRPGPRYAGAMPKASLLLCLATLVLVTALWRLLPRTETLPTAYGYIERDRWTGSAKACSVESPFNWLHSTSNDPMRVCLSLD